MDDHMSSFSDAEDALEREDPGRDEEAMVRGLRGARGWVVCGWSWGVFAASTGDDGGLRLYLCRYRYVERVMGR